MFERRVKVIRNHDGDRKYCLQKKVIIWVTVGHCYYKDTALRFLNPPSKQPPECLYPRTEITNE